MKKISIIMLTHNAPHYVAKAITSVTEHTKDVNYELIVVDNHSGFRTRRLVKRLYKEGKIHKLLLNKENLLFAKGNNAGARLAAEDTTHYLLLNSDVEIKEDSWLQKLAALCPEKGICSYGLVEEEPVRADGYCILIDRSIYDTYRLDEAYEWFWSITKIQAQALMAGRRVISVKNHEKQLHHFGGKSGKAYGHAAGMNEELQVIRSWFKDKRIEIAEQINGEINA